MPGSIYDWSVTAGQNDTADADIDWREGMFPDSVNDSARQMMGRNAEFRNDITGTLTPTGTANALLLTANSSFTSLANGRMLTFRAAVNNTGPVSINVNGLGSKAMRAMGATGDIDLVANDLKAGCPYTALYSSTANSGAGAWIIMSASRSIGTNRIDAFPVGTRLLFQQSAAPTGWIKDTTHNDKALRLVSGTVMSGGTVAFATVFSSVRPTTGVTQGGTVGGTAITVAQMPTHAHTYSGTTSGQSASHSHGATLTGGTDTQGIHQHSTTFGQGGGISNVGGAAVAEPGFGPADTITSNPAGNHSHNVTVSGNTGGASNDHTHAFSGTTSSQGSGEPHTHTFTGDAHSHTTDLAVQYVDVIICEKAA